VQFRSLLTLAVSSTVLCAAGSYNFTQNDVFSRAIRELGGTVVDPSGYSQSVEGFQKYLTDSAVSTVSASELTEPHHPTVAARLGFQNFLPPKEWWPRGAALALLTQNIEQKAGVAVHVRNWWRPPAYNTNPAVGGAKFGDHPTACALDLDYPTVASRMQAELYLRALERRSPWMQLSFGFGAQTTHVGLASPRGHREWHYTGWRPAIGRALGS
jgi:hypothetical protein